MALAILEYAAAENGAHRFNALLGSNRFYAYAVGDQQSTKSVGGRVLRDTSYKSPLLGPLPDIAHGKVSFVVPARQLDAKHRYLQLYSFRNQELAGPAYSEVLAVPLTSPGSWDDRLPPLHGPEAHAMSYTYDRTDNVAFAYQEVPLTSAMFFQMLTGLLPKLIPVAGQLLGGLFGGKGGDGKGDAVGQLLPKAGELLGGLFGGEGGAAAKVNPDTIKQIADLLSQLLAGKPAASSLGYGSRRAQRAVAHALGDRRAYTEAQIAPALLAALPALMPVIEKALNPETIKAITDGISPNKLTGMVIDGIKDLAKLGIQLHEADLKHLRDLNPGVEDKALDQLLEGLALPNVRIVKGEDYRRVESVTVEFTGLTPLTLNGRTRVAYVHGRDLGFPLSLDTPRTIAKAELTLTIKRPETLEILAQRKQSARQLARGRLAVVPRLSAVDLKSLPANHDYLLSIELTWPNRKGEACGTSRSQLITLIGDVAFDRIEDTVGSVALDDGSKHRAFWHKVWEGAFSDELRRVSFDLRYLVALRPDSENNGRMQTLVRIDERKFHHDLGKLKSGMEISPSMLNRALPQISEYATLPPPELAALAAEDFKERFNQAARGQIDVTGAPGEIAQLWAYPELSLQHLTLREAKDVDEHGHVRSTEDKTVVFAIPSLIHLVAVSPGRTERENRVLPKPNAEPAVFAGMKVQEHKRLPLYPVHLAKRKAAADA